MAQFHPLRVSDIRRETRDSVVVTLEPAADAADDFKFTQGQYLTFRRNFDGEELRRSYSVCSGVNDGTLRVGIKKVDGGWFSSFANDELKIGDTLEAMKPMGNFHSPLKPDEARHYLGFAGGSGITPLVSIIKTVLDAEPKSTFTLVYGNRSANSIMFREELEDLKNTNMGRLNIIHMLETEADIDLFSGILTREKCDELFGSWVNVKGADLAFICGPEPMMLSIADALKAHGMDEAAIKFELFASAQPGKAKKRAAPVDGANAGASCKATIILDGVRREVEMDKRGQSVLDAALGASLDAPFACKAGVCSTCRAKVIEGESEMEANYALEDYEVERGYVLTCQCYPLSDKIVIDYDQ
ncbi:MAG: phenylacetic acid degradation protein [Hyphococcus sp.]|nr:MAG: phenylacetic acid degradation protein [Marinicaulis sp.]